MANAAVTPERTPQGWGGVAQEYDTHIARYTRLYGRDALDATRVERGERVLDVAAGSGALSLEAARRGCRVLATDFAPEMVDLLRERAKLAGLEVDARVMDGQDLRLPDASFDAAYSILGLMFFPAPDQGMRELRRVLRDGGRVGVVVWNAPERSETFSTLFEAIQEAVPGLPEPEETPAVFSLADADDLASRLERAGFRDVHVRQLVHRWEDESPQASWDAMTTSNPVMPGIMRQIGPENAAKVRDAYLRIARSRVRDGKVSLRAEAHLATAWV